MKMKKRIIIKINRKGFSLIEMMVALGILSLLIIGSVTFFSGGTRAWVTGQYQLEAQRNARLAMDRMVKEIREGNNIDEINSNPTTIKINYLASFGKNSVTYSLSDNTISRDGIPLINNVKTLNFTYPDAPAPISKVHILLEVDVDKDDSPDIILNTDVNLRNYGL
jgi:prepilin-type N-terminal cleavage/methylation domain-containing protein